MDRRMKISRLAAILWATLLAFAWTPTKARGDDEGLGGALFGGDVVGNIRLRYEHADTSSLEPSAALTLRTRLGYATKPFHGLNGFVEFEDIQVLNDPDDYSQAGLNQGASGKTVIADVDGTELNKVHLTYAAPETNLSVRVGRQRILSGSSRYIPMNTYWIDRNFVWRQNEQTMDAATLRMNPLDGVELFYAYVDNIHRPFGHERGSSPPGEKMNAAEIRSDSHLVNVGYAPCRAFSTTLYGYSVDLGDGRFAAMNSSDTFGLALTGDIGLGAEWTLRYVADYARQVDNGASPKSADFAVDYYKLGLSAAVAGFRIGGYREVLGSDDDSPFRSVLATPHKLNGWADVFIVTPDDGLIDTCLFAHYHTEKYQASVRVHDFVSETDESEYGRELDLLLSWRAGKHVSLLAKYAVYEADSRTDNPAGDDTERFWILTDVYF